MVTKLYTLNRDAYRTAMAQSTKPLPPQQKLILEAMTKMKLPATGRDIVAYAIEYLGLVTRQRPEVLYAWYARANEEYGVELHEFLKHHELEEFIKETKKSRRKAA